MDDETGRDAFPPRPQSLHLFQPMKLNRREMLTLAGAAMTGAALGRLEATEQRLPDTKPWRRFNSRQPGAAPVCLADFEPLAKERLSHFAYEYISSGVADELTIR